LSNADGRVTIMMPHPERVFRTAQLSLHPADWGECSRDSDSSKRVLKHPVSALIRLLPALLWLFVLAYTLSFVRAVLFFPRETERTALDFGFALGFLAVAIYAGVQAFRECKRVLPALRADTSVWTGLLPRRPKPIPPRQRHPLTEPLRARLRELVDLLQTAGILQSAEVIYEQIIECAEMEDDYSTIDMDDVVRVLMSVKHERGRPFANLTFFVDQFEYRAEDAVDMVREFARLCGRSAGLGAVVRVKGIDGGEVVPAGRGTFPPHNARVEFELDGRPRVVSFVMYYKNLPLGLTHGLAREFAPAGPRVFASGGFDDMTISFLDPVKVEALNRALSSEFDHFEVLE
jgi:hypothetical protein